MSLLFPGYLGLFLSCFLSATFLPFSSEVVLVYMLYQKFDVWTCLLIATSANTLGGMTNYLVGLLGKPTWLKRIGMTEEFINRSEIRIQKYGHWLALLSWVPFIGDPLTAALGFFRVPWKPVFLLVTSGKFLRYFLVVLPFL